MDIGRTLDVRDRESWHEWLQANFDTAKEIWLVVHHKDSGKTRVPYNDAVEEALSFGWIDSTVKRLNEHSSVQRFSPRNPDSEYSQANKERLHWLLKEGRLHPSVRKSVDQILETEFVFPPDILRAIRKNTTAWEHFQSSSPAYQRIRIAYINGARSRPAEFERRLNYFLKKTELNQLIGYGGIEKYY